MAKLKKTITNCHRNVDSRIYQHLQFNIQNSTKFAYETKMTMSNVVIQAFNIVNGTLSAGE
jgi:hypothetical protein